MWPTGWARDLLVPGPEIEPVPPAMEALSLNHWTARETPHHHSFYYLFFILFIYLFLAVLLPCAGFSLRWLLLLWSTGSRLPWWLRW